MPKLKQISSLLLSLRTLIVAFAVVGLIVGMDFAHADQYDSQINALQQANNANQAQVNSLAAQAGSYQEALSQIQNQIDALQAALNVNQAKQASLEQQILDDQQKVALNKQYLGDALRTMYVDGQLTTIEELATSQSLSAYVDKETYRTTVQNKVDSLIQQIASLEAQQKQQKAQLDVTVNIEKQQASQLASAQAQQQQLLAYNQSQQSAYNAQIASNQSQIASLQAAQAAANRRLDSSGQLITSGSCGGSYPATASSAYGPWGCNYEHTSDYVQGCAYQDDWGMCNRECVSYTAWMVYKTYGIDTSGFGNAVDWPSSARAAGILTGYTPKVGSVAIFSGYSGDKYGHAMWVVGVSGNQIHVYSYNDGYDGNFYDHWVNASGLTYIYFGG